MTQRSCSWTTLVVEVASGNTQRQDRDEDENDGFAIDSIPKLEATRSNYAVSGCSSMRPLDTWVMNSR
jgi:hypothetical protein